MIDPEHRVTLAFRLGNMRRLLISADLRVIAAWRGGWIFPNRMPRFLLPVVRRLPYRFPFGITNWVVGERPHVGVR
jgi:hypothetical protein